MDFVLCLSVCGNHVLMVRNLEEAERWLRDSDMVYYSMLCASPHRIQYDWDVRYRKDHGQGYRVPLQSVAQRAADYWVQLHKVWGRVHAAGREILCLDESSNDEGLRPQRSHGIHIF